MKRPYNILLVEDDESDRSQALRSIGNSGFECNVAIANTGDEACQILEENNYEFELVLLDIKLPRLSGFEVLEHIRACTRSKNVPVVMLSSSDEPKDVERSLTLGANSYMLKQMNPDLGDASLKIALSYWLLVHTRAQVGVYSLH